MMFVHSGPELRIRLLSDLSRSRSSLPVVVFEFSLSFVHQSLVAFLFLKLNA